MFGHGHGNAKTSRSVIPSRACASSDGSRRQHQPSAVHLRRAGGWVRACHARDSLFMKQHTDRRTTTRVIECTATVVVLQCVAFAGDWYGQQLMDAHDSLTVSDASRGPPSGATAIWPSHLCCPPCSATKDVLHALPQSEPMTVADHAPSALWSTLCF